MARLIAGSFSFDMTNWDLSDLAGGAVTADGTTEVDVTGASGKLAYTITGTGFTTFDTNGFPTDGTVTGFTEGVPGRAPVDISGISISASDFMGFVNANDAAGLEAAIFAGNDVFGGRGGNDVLLGFGGNDSFNMTKGGNDTVDGGDGNDVISFGGAFTAADSVDGGTGADKLALNGDYSAGVVFGATTMVNVEAMTLVGKHDYNLTFNATSDTASQSLNVTASGVTGGHHVVLDGSALAGTLRLVGTAGDDTLSGGAGSNTLNGGDGNDTIYAGTGDNHINGGHGNNTFYFSNWTVNDYAAGGGLIFNGDFSGGATLLGAQLVADSSRLILAGGHDYTLTLGAGTALSYVGSPTPGAPVNGVAMLGPSDHLNVTVDSGAATGLYIEAYYASADVTVNGATSTVLDATYSPEGQLHFQGGSGDDYVGAGHITADDRIDGGSGNDMISFGGLSVTFDADTIKNISKIETGSSTIVTNDGNVAAGQNLIVTYAPTSGTPDSIFDGSAETDGSFTFISYINYNNHFTGGAGDDMIEMGTAMSDTVNVHNVFDGGGGNDTIEVISDINSPAIKFGDNMLVNIETIDVKGAIVVTSDGNVAAGHTMNVVMNGGRFNGSLETDGSFAVTGDSNEVKGGAGDDTMTLSNDPIYHTVSLHFQGNGGADTFTVATPGTTHGDFIYLAASDSTSTSYDTITNFYYAKDVFDLWFTVTAIDAHVSTGALSTASFDTDLAAAVGASQLGVHHAMIFTPDSGSLAHQSFIVVDANGVAGYQAGQDLVIDINSPADLTLKTGNFI